MLSVIPSTREVHAIRPLICERFEVVVVIREQISRGHVSRQRVGPRKKPGWWCSVLNLTSWPQLSVPARFNSKTLIFFEARILRCNSSVYVPDVAALLIEREVSGRANRPVIVGNVVCRAVYQTSMTSYTAKEQPRLDARILLTTKSERASRYDRFASRCFIEGSLST